MALASPKEKEIIHILSILALNPQHSDEAFTAFERLSESEREEFLSLADSNHVVLRALEPLQRQAASRAAEADKRNLPQVSAEQPKGPFATGGTASQAARFVSNEFLSGAEPGAPAEAWGAKRWAPTNYPTLAPVTPTSRASSGTPTRANVGHQARKSRSFAALRMTLLLSSTAGAGRRRPECACGYRRRS